MAKTMGHDIGGGRVRFGLPFVMALRFKMAVKRVLFICFGNV